MSKIFKMTWKAILCFILPFFECLKTEVAWMEQVSGMISRKKTCIAERKNFKLLFSVEIVLAGGVSDLYISSNDAILPGSPPRASLPLPHLLTAGQTSINEESAFSLSLTKAYSSSRQMDISTRESTFNIGPLFSLGYNYFFLLNQLDLRTSCWRINSCSTIDNSFLLPAIYNKRLFFFSSQTVIIKTSLLKTINIFVNSFVIPLNITRGNWSQQPQLPFSYEW